MRKKAYLALGLVLITGVLFFACKNETPNDDPNSLIVTGTFQSDIGAQPAVLSINFGNDITSRDQIKEVISGTITDNGKTTEIKGTYNRTFENFCLSGLSESTVVYYVEGFLNSSFKFNETKVKIAKKEDAANKYSWSMKENHDVTNK